MDLAPYIDRMRSQLADVEQQLSQPDAFSERERAQRLTRDHQRLSKLVAAFDRLQARRRQLADNQVLIANEKDAEFKELIVADNAAIEAEIAELEITVLNLVVPPEDVDSRNTIIEIRPAAGGEEAALFAYQLFRMYTHYAEGRGWKVEVMDLSETELGGLKDVSFTVVGEDVYKELRLESGVHRVQRVPETEASGRIHTSTVTVAVLAEARDVEVEINPADLKVDVYRSSGAGGQHVNKTDSAVRMTHLPTGVVVASQQERSQHRNRDICMRMLKTKILEARRQEEAARYAAVRKSQVGTGDRSERIRTYNFPQNRVTDHRYGLSFYNLPVLIEGGIGPLLAQINAAYNAERLDAELNKGAA